MQAYRIDHLVARSRFRTVQRFKPDTNAIIGGQQRPHQSLAVTDHFLVTLCTRSAEPATVFVQPLGHTFKSVITLDTVALSGATHNKLFALPNDHLLVVLSTSSVTQPTASVTQPIASGTQLSGFGTQPTLSGTQPTAPGTPPAALGTQPATSGTKLYLIDLKNTPHIPRVISPPGLVSPTARFFALPEAFLARSSFVFGMLGDAEANVYALDPVSFELRLIAQLQVPLTASPTPQKFSIHSVNPQVVMRAVAHTPSLEQQLYCLHNADELVILSALSGGSPPRVRVSIKHPIAAVFQDHLSQHVYVCWTKLAGSGSNTTIARYDLSGALPPAPISEPSLVLPGNEFALSSGVVYDPCDPRTPLLLMGLSFLAKIELVNPLRVGSGRDSRTSRDSQRRDIPWHFNLMEPRAEIVTLSMPPQFGKRINRILLRGRYALLHLDDALSLLDWVFARAHTHIHTHAHVRSRTGANVQISAAI